MEHQKVVYVNEFIEVVLVRITRVITGASGTMTPMAETALCPITTWCKGA